MCSPTKDWGEGAGTKAPGDGTWRGGLLGELAVRRAPGDGVPIKVADGDGLT